MKTSKNNLLPEESTSNNKSDERAYGNLVKGPPCRPSKVDRIFYDQFNSFSF